VDVKKKSFWCCTQDLDSVVGDTMDVSYEKCADPSNSDLPSAVVDAERYDDGGSEHLGSAVVEGATGNEGNSGTESSEQTGDGKFDACANSSEAFSSWIWPFA
jgi:hypothetical protein